MNNVNHLMLYRNMDYSDLFFNVTNLITLIEENTIKDLKKEEITSLTNQLFQDVNQLVELAIQYGFKGNVWHNFLAFIIANNENAFSITSEVSGNTIKGLQEIANHDFEILFRLFKFEMKKIDDALKVNCFSYLESFENNEENRIRECVINLSLELAQSEDSKNYCEIITRFYKNYGVGKFGLHKAFRINDKNNAINIVPITNILNIQLNDLIGYEIQKKKLVDNTKAFVEGKKANNVLLFGDSGTGKSSAIKAILNEYFPQGLRMIEVYKHQFRNLTDVIEQIKDRKYKFIIFMDDLSFEDYEVEYKYLKAIIEGGIGIKPDNVLIYATSNRRHLVREKWSDKEDRREDLHASDTVAEKLSLSARFGVSIFYGAPDKKQFDHIVCELANRYGIQMNKDQLLLEANKWELSHGGLSGRTATQFIQYLLHCNF